MKSYHKLYSKLCPQIANTNLSARMEQDVPGVSGINKCNPQVSNAKAESEQRMRNTGPSRLYVKRMVIVASE